MNTRLAIAVGSAALVALLGACTGTTDTDQPTVTVTQEAAPAPAPVESSPRESSSSGELSRETELAILKVSFDQTVDSMSYSEMADICHLWTSGDEVQAVALEMVVEGFASTSSNQHLTEADVRRVVRNGFDDYCGG